MRVLVAVIALIMAAWMFIPAITESATEIGFPAGSPDPNTYTTNFEFGSPLPWLVWTQVVNEAEAREESSVTAINWLPLLVHLIMVVVPVGFLVIPSTKRANSSKDRSIQDGDRSQHDD